MRDSGATRRRILKAAAALFIEQGFEGTTLIKVSEASGASVGSITHFCGDKGELAARVYDYAAGLLAADARTALRGHGNDAPAAIRALLSACLSWDERYPNYRRLIRMLEVYAPMSQRSRTDEERDSLPKVLADWANPLARKDIVAQLSPSQLYAVILAPAMCAATPDTGPASDVRASSIDWLTVLTDAALTAIAPPKKKARRAPPASPRGETAQRDLLQ
ncbi:MAG: TetR/AcrR family transcriptional regulator [Stellaceae bacterium]